MFYLWAGLPHKYNLFYQFKIVLKCKHQIIILLLEAKVDTLISKKNSIYQVYKILESRRLECIFIIKLSAFFLTFSIRENPLLNYNFTMKHINITLFSIRYLHL